MIPSLFGKKVVNQPDNPYVTGNPVTGDAFVGRQDIFRAVKSMISSPHKNAITLFGQRRIGKTSVLKKLEIVLSATSTDATIKYIPVYFDLMDQQTHQPLDDIVAALGIEVCKKLAMKVPQWQTPLTQFLDWLVDLLQSNQEITLVILFDEFDSLDDAKSEHLRDEFFRYLKQLLAIDAKRLNIVFTIGRNIDDFKTAQALFKNIDNYRISLLDQKNTEQLICISEQNESLYWSKAAIQRVWQLTNGHPYLTQLLCSLIWDHYWNQSPKIIPTVTIKDVGNAAHQVIKNQQAGQNALEWLWSGLPPACRVDVAAFAELGNKLISHKELIEQMYAAGIGTVIEELENAPKDLKEWDIIEGDAQSGYRFRVELFRQWVKENKSLRNIMQDELRRIRVEAEQYYQTAEKYHASGKFDEAIDKLEGALRINSHFIEAHRLLARVLVDKGDLTKAREKLEKFYQSFPDQARPQFVELLWSQVESTSNKREQLDLCEEILRLDSAQASADNKRKEILQHMAQQSEKNKDYIKSLEIYRRIGTKKSKDDILRLQRKIFWNKWGKWISGALVFTVAFLISSAFFYLSQQWEGSSVVWSIIFGTIFGFFAVFSWDKIYPKDKKRKQRF